MAIPEEWGGWRRKRVESAVNGKLNFIFIDFVSAFDEIVKEIKMKRN